MVPRKKRITILVVAIILIILILIGILTYLILKTDIFKSKETLFAKYLIQNFENVEFLNLDNNSEIKNVLNTNKYTSNIEGEIKYTENIGTSNENTDSKINDVGIEINSCVDKTNKYDYKDISIQKENNKLIGFEYLNQDEIYGIKLNGIQQFVSVKSDGENEGNDDYQKYDIKKLTSEIDIGSILKFTEEEKKTLLNTYIGIIQSNISSDKYYKQPKALITIDNKDILTNAYYMKLTVEEFNNVYIKILEQFTKDEIILSKVDMIQEEIEKRNPYYEQDENLRDIIIKKINEKVEVIKNNNIGNEDVKITVYESNGKCVRFSIEKTTEKLTIDVYNDSTIKIDSMELSDYTKEQILVIEEKKSDNQLNLVVDYKMIQNNEVENELKLDYTQEFDNNKLDKTIQLEISNEKYKVAIKIIDNTKIVDEFDNKITFEDNNIRFDDISKEKKELISQVLEEEFQTQLSNLFSVVSLDDYKKMLQNIDILKKNSVEISNNGQISEIEKKRFNSQFEFFVSENLTMDNMIELLKTVENNFEDVKILTQNGEIQELNMKDIESLEDKQKYEENISEILIYTKSNSKNEEKYKNILNFIEDNKNNKYTTSIEYDDNGLARVIRAKIQED